ncbi:peptidoglycan DD-metalloendopeptidase family protein [Marinomonas ostreistagni]|uniref:peptidoglycan DD-metalloendopeptidase family protein n=1 Tax=Marinomonas ostreistagni TaxID=359209 RepID=UPI00195038E0|nr:peptidoglycan DD-metalloendopeptidase family protein [Marinomonas ostreistagni]MBM6551749.1 peptidoglycan DD-metalloendopeptidase family protein [Marinomonas ostreistagni]
MVHPIKKLRWLPKGPRLWALLIVSVFVLFLLIYDNAVTDDQRDENYQAMPNSRIELAPISAQVADAPKPPSLDALAPALPDGIGERVTQDEMAPSLEGQMAQSVDKPRLVEHTIESGNTLEGIFNKYGFPISTMYELLEADQEYLVLEPLQVGDKLRFKTDEKDQLVALSRRIDPSKTITYVKHDEGGFMYTEDVKPINYVQYTKHGEVQGSFYLSAKRTGLSDANVMVISDLLKNRLDFRRDLRKGDEFDVVLKQGEVDGQTFGSVQVEAVRIKVRGEYYQAFLHTDGRFYDADGNSLTPALRRWPTSVRYRISSGFNPNRLHPVTGRPAPHNGTDLATPTGTKVYATGDGIVTRTANHRYAGKYIDIDNIGKYNTRFLHLNKILVKRGQRVKRGQVIALSGATGRITGPHLHYELHVNGRPVNPMTAKIPTMQSIPSDEQAGFKASIGKWTQLMDAQQEL